jgi:hypothetical protein
MSGKLAFLGCVERGKLEDQTILLCRSIRQFGGAYRDAPIYTFQPRHGTEVGEPTLAVLGELGVVHISEVLNTAFADYGTLNKIFVCAYAERVLPETVLVFLDSDTVVTGEPAGLDLPPDVEIAIRPADSTHLNSRGPGDPLEAYWQRVFYDRGMDEVPFVETELGRRVRAFFSAGLVAVRREAGVFREWADAFRQLADRGIVLDGLFARMDEVALTATVIRRFARARLLDLRYNYLVYRRPIMIPPLRQLLLSQVVHLHYRFAFYKPGFLRSVQPSLGLDGPVLPWLERYLPLQPTIEDAEDTTRVAM